MSDSAGTPASGDPRRRPIGEFLVERGLVTPHQLHQAIAAQRGSGKRLGEILIERGAITRMVLASVLSEQWEEAGRHLRAVAPVRLAGGDEAVLPASNEELTHSLAALHTAVSKLEELAAGPPVAATGEPGSTAVLDRIRQLEELVAEIVASRDDRLAEQLEGLRGAVLQAVERHEATIERLERVAGPEAHAAELAARDAVIEELTRRLGEVTTDDRGPRPGEHTSFVALVPSPSGYDLLSREGPLPEVGSELDVGGGGPFVVVRLGRSPLPGDARRCAFLERA